MKALRYDPKNLLTSLVLVFPLFLIYQVGVLFTLPVLNGADFLTVFLFRNLGLSAARLPRPTRRRSRSRSPSRWRCCGASSSFDPRLIVPVLRRERDLRADDGVADRLRDDRACCISPRLAGRHVADQGLATRFVMSLGAGVYEETVFRLGIMTGSRCCSNACSGSAAGWRSRVALRRVGGAVLGDAPHPALRRSAAPRRVHVPRAGRAASSACSSGSAASPSRSTRTPSTTSTCCWSAEAQAGRLAAARSGAPRPAQRLGRGLLGAGGLGGLERPRLALLLCASGGGLVGALARPWPPARLRPTRTRAERAGFGGGAFAAPWPLAAWAAAPPSASRPSWSWRALRRRRLGLGLLAASSPIFGVRSGRRRPRPPAAARACPCGCAPARVARP